MICPALVVSRWPAAPAGQQVHFLPWPGLRNQPQQDRARCLQWLHWRQDSAAFCQFEVLGPGFDGSCSLSHAFSQNLTIIGLGAQAQLQAKLKWLTSGCRACNRTVPMMRRLCDASVVSTVSYGAGLGQSFLSVFDASLPHLMVRLTIKRIKGISRFLFEAAV